MEYDKYLEKIKDFARKSTLRQRFLAGFVLLVLLGGYVVYLNPAKKLLEMRNSQRRSDVVNILNAVYQYSKEPNVEFPTSITQEPIMICRSDANSCEGLIDISQILVLEKRLLSKVPVDPNEEDSNISGYQISRFANGRISVTAPLAENGVVINFSK
jgi:hypothetical protein